MKNRSLGFVLVGASLLGVCGVPAAAQGLAEIVQRELGVVRPGVVVALHVDGDLQFFEAYGKRGSTPRGRAAPAQADFEPAHTLPPADRWAGTYRNGDLIFVLRASGGVLVLFDGSRELDLEAGEGARVVARLPDGRIAVRLDLIEDTAGRRFLYFGGLAYRHGEDELGG